MGKKNKSKRFIQQGCDSVSKHDEQFPYRHTLAEAEAEAEKMRNQSFSGGF
ncbi:competence protein [Ectobacillus sp. sgz5001026]|uniref:competence protein n=1 Tax=Ectobacillus sp. sgz5001026 TaxID=3242473 RepID=UPI0036D3C20A